MKSLLFNMLFRVGASQVSLLVNNLFPNAGDTRDIGLIPGSGRSPVGERAWYPTPIFLPREFHGHRSLVGYGPRLQRVRYDWSDLAYTQVCHSFPSKDHNLLISWIQSTMILELKKIKSVTASTVSPSICHEVMELGVMILAFWMLSSSQPFHSSLLPSSRGSLVSPHFLPFEWYHLHAWNCWYFSHQSRFQLVIRPAWQFTSYSLHVS